MNQNALREMPPWTRLTVRFIFGTSYLVLVSLMLSQASGRNFVQVLALNIIASITVLVIAMVLWTRWVLAEQGRRWQINISSILLVVVILSIYFGMMRWFLAGAQPSSSEITAPYWIAGVFVSFLYLVYTIPFMLFLGESVMWFAAWFIRRRVTQSVLRRLIGSSAKRR